MRGTPGLVTGDIVDVNWVDVSYIIQLGGTELGTARSDEFRTPEGRRQAALNLIRAGIDRLVVIGGDGSLTGAATLQHEWGRHVQALREAGEVSDAPQALSIVGMIGSIDNDMWGTDSTIGCDSALTRIVEAVDSLTSTARSHQRSFVVEVMGRRCGWLAAAAAVATGGDYLFVPEAPVADWQQALQDAVEAGRAAGRRKSIVFVAEGAIDIDGAPITAEMVKAALDSFSASETRITVLGHVQRGGAPSALDRLLPTRMGVAAVDLLLNMDDSSEPMLMTTAGQRIEAKPLLHCVAKTQETAELINARRFAAAAESRGAAFAELLALQFARGPWTTQPEEPRRLLIAHVGAPAPGMNAAVQTVVRWAGSEGVTVDAATEGLRGLLEGDVRTLSWRDVDGLTPLGATVLGTNRFVPDPEDPRLEEALAPYDGVVLIGGFACLGVAARIRASKPVVVLPATISNNVPGTDRSIGSDTACNVVCEAVDRLKQSAVGSRDRVFFVEVMGRRCGYLAETAGVSAGAEFVYTHEQGVRLTQIQEDIQGLLAAFYEGKSVAIVLASDGASDAYDIQTLADIYGEESEGRFDTRVCVLGHLQQGGRPSPADRVLASQMARRGVDAVLSGRSGLIGELDGAIRIAPLETLVADNQLRRPKWRAGETEAVKALALPPSA